MMKHNSLKSKQRTPPPPAGGLDVLSKSLTNNGKPKIRLAIVDDHPLVRSGMISYINSLNKRYEIHFAADGGREFMSKVHQLGPPDIVILDLSMQDIDGLETTKWLKKNHPRVKIIILTMDTDDQTLMELLRLNIDGYLLKTGDLEELPIAIDAVWETGQYFTDKQVKLLINYMQSEWSIGEVNPTPVQLTEVEKQYLSLVCGELTYGQIARKLNLNEKAMDRYRIRFFVRYKVRTRVTLALYLRQNKIV